MNYREDDEHTESRERLLTTMRRLPTGVQITGVLAGAMAAMVMAQSIANIISSFITSVLGPIIQWLVK